MLFGKNVKYKKAVLWIRIGFNADPDPAFYIKADPDPGFETNEDPFRPGSGSCSELPSQKVEFLH